MEIAINSFRAIVVHDTLLQKKRGPHDWALNMLLGIMFIA